MNIDFGLAVVLAASLIFYLRLIILQRERVKRNRQELEAAARKSKQRKGVPPGPRPSYSILSKNRVDLAIAGVGVLAIIFGAMLNANMIQYASLRSYWWLPMALGILAFSWAFKL
jgi:hypothetical protein